MLILYALAACKREQVQIVTYDLKPKSFVEKIYLTGTLESENNFTITTPPLSAPEIKVDYLAPEGTFARVGDTVCILAAPEIQNYYDRFSEELESLQAGLTKLEADNLLQLSMLNAQLEQNKAGMSLSELDSLQIKYAPPVKQKILKLELEKKKITEEKLQKKMDAQKRISEQTIRAMKSQIIQKEQYVLRYKEQLDMCYVTAPKEGMIIHASSPGGFYLDESGNITEYGGQKIKVGDNARRRMGLIELPDMNNMQVILMLQEGDFKRIEKGQKVLIQPDAVDSLKTTGTISLISLVGQPMAMEYKVNTHKITASVDSLDNQMLPGLSANCEIIIQNIADTIVVPSMSIFEKDSTKLVYVARGDNFLPVQIETGTANRSETIVSSGLRGNETIALVEPPINRIEKSKSN